jgi:hypothetical protein
MQHDATCISMTSTVCIYACCLSSAGETICESYDTEYSTDKIEMHTGAINAGQRVLLVRPAARSLVLFCICTCSLLHSLCCGNNCTEQTPAHHACSESALVQYRTAHVL